MATMNGSVDLYALKGVELCQGINPVKMEMQYICIPVDWNDIQLVGSQEHPEQLRHAYLGMRLRDLPESYRTKVRTDKQSRGEASDENHIPTHTAEAAFSEGFRERARVAAKKRILEQFKDQWTTPEQQDPQTNPELRKLIYQATQIRLGRFFTYREQETAWKGTASQANGVTTGMWNPPTDTHDANDGGGYEDSDLPF